MKTVEVRIRFLGGFAIFADGEACETAFGEKQIAAMRVLVLEREKGICLYRLITELNMNGTNPENALKTLISRTRARLNKAVQGLGSCIVSRNGKYCWRNIPGLTVDLQEVLEVLDRLDQKPAPAETEQLTERLIDLYKGELEGEYWLHRAYLDAVYNYVGLLRSERAFDKILSVCRRAMAVDELDEHLRILHVEALVSLDMPLEALREYYKMVRQTQEYFCTEQSDELKNCYARLAATLGDAPLPAPENFGGGGSERPSPGELGA